MRNPFSQWQHSFQMKAVLQLAETFTTASRHTIVLDPLPLSSAPHTPAPLFLHTPSSFSHFFRLHPAPNYDFLPPAPADLTPPPSSFRQMRPLPPPPPPTPGPPPPCPPSCFSGPCRGIHPYKGPVMRKLFPSHDVTRQRYQRPICLSLFRISYFAVRDFKGDGFDYIEKTRQCCKRERKRNITTEEELHHV